MREARRGADALRAEVVTVQRELDEQQGKLDRAREQVRVAPRDCCDRACIWISPRQAIFRALHCESNLVMYRASRFLFVCAFWVSTWICLPRY